MPIQIVRNDITKMKVDAIVNAANETLLGGGGVDGAIHAAAGPGLLAECHTLGGCATGDARITGAYNLPCKYIIHTVGPVYRDGQHGEKEKLISCYRRSLELAKAHGCETVAFPMISAGAYAYPISEALCVATDTIRDFLLDNEMTVYIVVFGKSAYQLSGRLYSDVRAFVDDNYVDAHRGDDEAYRARRYASRMQAFGRESNAWQTQPRREAAQEATLEECLKMRDESFSEMVLRKIKESGMTNAETYRRANVTAPVFSRLRNDKNYQPSKSTALAFAVALKLPMRETRELLEKAGYALTRTSVGDIIVEYFISRGRCNVDEINAVLFDYDQTLLGNVPMNL